MNLPDGRRGQLVALGILLIVLLVISKHLLIPTIDSYLSIDEDISDSLDQLQRYQRIANNLPSLRQEATKLDKQQPLRSFLLSGNNRSLAAAALQNRFKELVSRHGGRIMSTRTLQAIPDGSFEQIPLVSRIQIGLQPLQQVIHELEQGKPYIFVDQLNITARRARRNHSTSQVDVRITVHSLRPLQEEASRG